MKEKYAFIVPKGSMSTFIRKDIDLLREFGEVIILEDIPTKKNPFKIIRALRNHKEKVKGVKIIFGYWLYSWYPALLALINKKPYILISAGVDTLCDKEIGYGALCNKIQKFVVKYNVKHCSTILLHHECLKGQLESSLGMEVKNYNVAYLSVDPNKWLIGNEKRKYITCVALNSKGTRERHLVKGIDRFINLALTLPNYPFLLVGYSKDILTKLEQKIPNNLELIPYLKQNRLSLYYQQTKIYCQLSRHETLAGSVLESILSGCYPIVSNVGGLPSEIGPIGYIHDFDQDPIENLYDKIKEIYKKNFINLEGRTFVSKKYSWNNRKEVFKKILEQY
ncbi:MAG: glycosyltransferase family 4 protein [Promethearchaeota archaeon]